MIIHPKNRPALAASGFAILGCGLALLTPPVLAQTPTAGSTPSPETPATVAPPAEVAATPVAAAGTAGTEAVPSWLIPLAVAGGVLGLIGTGLATMVFLKTSGAAGKVGHIEAQQLKLSEEMPQLRARIPGPSDVERFICVQLRREYDENSGPGFWLSNAINSMASQQAEAAIGKHVLPKLQAAEEVGASTQNTLENLIGHQRKRDTELGNYVQTAEARMAQLEKSFRGLDENTRAEIEGLIFNLYNLLFTQSEGDPIVSQLEERVVRYEQLVSELRALQPDEITRLTLREFEESIAKIARQIEIARAALAGMQGADSNAEPLPYLEEKDSAQAKILLEEQRKKLRGQTAGAKESLDGLRDAAIELYKPLQTLWMGASVMDVDKPERTERCKALLVQIQTILSRFGLEIYQARVGEEIDTSMVSYKFAEVPHEAPFIAQKVTKLGLKVEDRVEQGAVVVA